MAGKPGHLTSAASPTKNCLAVRHPLADQDGLARTLTDKRCRAHLKRTNKSYRIDETYIRIKRQDPISILKGGSGILGFR